MSDSKPKWDALQRIIARVPAHLALYGSALGAFVIAGTNWEGTVSIVGNIGAGILGSLIADIAEGKNISDEDIRQRAEEAIIKSNKLLEEKDFWHGFRLLFKQLDEQKAVNQEILGILRQGSSNQSEKLTSIEEKVDQVLANQAVFQKQQAPSNSQLGKLRGVPDVHENYLDRASDLADLRDTVLKHKRTALVGMGGVGKTVLAAILCRDPALREAFPDGIYWLTFGTEPKIEILQTNLAISLEGKHPQLSGEATLRTYLTSLLQDKKVLLVLDDIWIISHIDSFADLGDGVQLLVTTRKGDVADRLNAKQHKLEPLDDKAARALLAKACEIAETALPTAASDILGKCAGLPLALNMIGRILRGKPANRWQEKLEALKKGRLDHVPVENSEYGQYNNLSTVIDVSVRDLDPRLQKCYLDLAVFPDDVEIPEATLATFFGADNPNLSTLEIIDTLVDRSLLQGYNQHYKLHDLQLDYVRARVEKEKSESGGLIGLHQRLLAAYNPTGKDWHEITDDGYLYTRLAYHLNALGQLDVLHELVTSSPAWRDAKFKALEGDASFSADVAILLGQYRDPLTPESALRLAQLRAAQQAVSARTSRYDDQDLEVLVWLGRERESLGYAQLRSDPVKKFSGLLAVQTAMLARAAQHIAATPEMQVVIERLDVQLADLVRANAHKIKDEAINDFVVSLARRGKVNLAEEIARGIEDDFTRANALGVLAIALARVENPNVKQIFFEATQSARGIEDNHMRAATLRDLTVALAEAGLYIKAEEIAQSIEDATKRAEALWALAVALAEAGLYIKAEEIARSIEDDFTRANALSVLAVELARVGNPNVKQIFFEATQSAQGIEDDNQRTHAMVALAAMLNEAGDLNAKQIFAEAEQTARSIEGDFTRAYALRDLAVAMAKAGNPNAKQIFFEATQSARGIEDYGMRGRVMRGLTVALVEVGYYAEAEQIARGIEDDYYRAYALSDLAGALAKAGNTSAEKIFAEAALSARGADRGYRRSYTLRDIAVALAKAGDPNADQIFAEAITHKQDTSDNSVYASAGASALHALAVALVGVGHYTESVQIAQDIKKDRERAYALGEVAVSLAKVGDPNAKQIFAEAVQSARSMVSDNLRAYVLRDLAVEMAKIGDPNAKQIFAEAAQSARGIEHNERRAFTLSDLAGAMAKAGDLNARQIFAEAIALKQNARDTSVRTSALRDLTVMLAGIGRYSEAAQSTRDIEKNDERAYALRDLAVAMAKAGDPNAKQIFAEAAQSTRRIEDYETHARAMRELAIAMARTGDSNASQIFVEAVQSARVIEDDNRRASALCELAVALAEVEDPRAKKALDEAIVAAQGFQHSLYTLANILASQHALFEAFRILGQQDSPEYIQTLASWHPTFEHLEKGLFIRVLRATLLILAWEQPYWLSILDMLN
jgi:hypothetical protein